MANGTLKAASVYYNDLVKYPGTEGSATNPYCIEDYYDLKKLGSTSYVINNIGNFILVNDIDFGDYEETKYGRFGGYGAIAVCTGGVIDGNGHCLRNIILTDNNSKGSIGLFYINRSHITTQLVIKNLNIYNYVNIKYTDATQYGLFYIYTDGYDDSTGMVKFDSCKISMAMYCYKTSRDFGNNLIGHRMGIYSKTPRQVQFTNCVLNISANASYQALSNNASSNDALLPSGTEFYCCHINFKYNSGYNCTVINPNTYLQPSFFNSCYFTGEIYVSANNTYDPVYFDSKTTLYYSSCYFNVKFIYSSGITTKRANFFNSSAATSLACFVNKDILPNFNNTSSTTIKYLSESDCKNYDVLNGLGFPIIKNT